MIKLLLTPVMAVFNRLSIIQKFLIMLVLYIIPVVYITYFTVTTNAEFMKLNLSEQQGLHYVHQLSPLFKNIAQARGLTNSYLNGNEGVKTKISSLHQQIDTILTRVKSFEQDKENPLDPDFLLGQIESDWQSLKGNVFNQEAGKVFKKHTRIIETVLKLIIHSSENSGLILDPDKGTSYLLDSITRQLPLLSETIGKTRGLGAGIAAKGSFSSTNFVQLSNFVLTIDKTSEQLEHDLQGMINNKLELNSQFYQMKDKVLKAVKSFSDLTANELLEARKISINSNQYFSEGTKAIASVLELFDENVNLAVKLLEQKESELKFEIAINLISLFVLLATVIYFFTAFYQNIMLSIRSIKETVSKVADGDLTVQVVMESQDEMQMIAKHLNQMIEANRTLVSHVYESADEVVLSAQNNSTTAEATSEGLNEQNMEIEQVATAMNEMTATVHDVAQNAERTAEAAKNADDESSQGKSIVDQTISSIQLLSSEIETADTIIKELEVSASNIGNVLDVIQSIADQTNLLALNAAIEAARAGESGRGFAVVADEVRTLASRTQESTGEIRQMIEKLQSSANNATSAMSRGSEQSNITVKQAADAGAALNRIAEAVDAISQMSEQIASAAVEQSAVAEEINRSVFRVRDISETTANGANQTARTSEELQSISNQLKQKISLFRVE